MIYEFTYYGIDRIRYVTLIDNPVIIFGNIHHIDSISKKLFRVFATSKSSDIILPFSTRVITDFEVPLLEKKGFIYFQNLLLSFYVLKVKV